MRLSTTQWEIAWLVASAVFVLVVGSALLLRAVTALADRKARALNSGGIQ
jgi:hypothetical protein